MTSSAMSFDQLPSWHRTMISKLAENNFSGRLQIERQLMSASFTFIDQNGSLGIAPLDVTPAKVEKTIPVEASGLDADGIVIQVLLFTRSGIVYMLEILRGDGGNIIKMPAVSSFEFMVLGV